MCERKGFSLEQIIKKLRDAEILRCPNGYSNIPIVLFTFLGKLKITGSGRICYL
jgi:hypothetical protein